MNATLATIFGIAALASASPAQRILFSENFDNGLPATWTNFVLDTPLDPWSAGVSPASGSPDVFHDWFCDRGGLNRRNLLMSPRIDLSGLWRADFSCKQYQMNPTLRSQNLVQVSTDAGNTFTTLYDETGLWSGAGTIQFSLDAYAGLPDVRIAFLYEGAIANEWRIDDVRVTTPQPQLDIQGLNAGATATFDFREGVPGGLVVFAFSITGGGPLPTPFGPVGLTPPIETLAIRGVDPTGSATATIALPAAALGIALWAQAGELRADGSVQLSNHLSGTIQ
jgi:hypothetical protein